jgi:hypothetical protein
MTFIPNEEVVSIWKLTGNPPPLSANRKLIMPMHWLGTD